MINGTLSLSMHLVVIFVGLIAALEDIQKRHRWEMGLGLFPTLSLLELLRACEWL